MWIADILVALLGLYGVFGIAAAIWGIKQQKKDKSCAIGMTGKGNEKVKTHIALQQNQS